MKHFVFTEHSSCTMTTLSCLNAVSQKEVNNDEAAYRNAGLGGIRDAQTFFIKPRPPARLKCS